MVEVGAASHVLAVSLSHPGRRFVPPQRLTPGRHPSVVHEQVQLSESLGHRILTRLLGRRE